MAECTVEEVKYLLLIAEAAELPAMKRMYCLSPLNLPGSTIYKPLQNSPQDVRNIFCIPQIDQHSLQPNLDYILTNVQTSYCSCLKDVKAPFFDSVEVVRSHLLPFIRVLCPIFTKSYLPSTPLERLQVLPSAQIHT